MGKKCSSQNVSSILSPSTINQYFKEINTNPAYSMPQWIPPGTHIPALEVHTVQTFLAQQKRTAPGPDGLPHWMWRDFSHLLAPVITKLFNRSLEEQFVPYHWKLANITPIPKESPLTNCNQLRPISVTNIVSRRRWSKISNDTDRSSRARIILPWPWECVLKISLLTLSRADSVE